MDGKKLSEDEDDEDGQFIVEEAGPLPPDMPELEMVSVFEIQMKNNVYWINNHVLIIDVYIDHSGLQGPSIELQGDEKHGEW